eukprot:scaffold1541_cov418-Prasinococcus_capsulatus_cf.AAC.10
MADARTTGNCSSASPQVPRCEHCYTKVWKQKLRLARCASHCCTILLSYLSFTPGLSSHSASRPRSMGLR